MKIHLMRSVFASVFGAALWLGYAETSSPSRSDDFCPVSITGVQHLGRGYMISKFYVDQYGGDTVGRDGGGGSILCCAMLPVKWRPGLTVEIRWGVEDWTHADDAEIAKGNYESVIDEKLYIAKVPVEKYDQPYDLIVHFFPRGRVRVVTSVYSVSSPLHPVPFGVGDGGPTATAGWPIGEMFSQAELRKKEKEGGNPWK